MIGWIVFIFSLSQGKTELPRSNICVMILVFLSYQTLKYMLKYQLWQSMYFFLFFDQFLLNILWWSCVKYINFCCYIRLGNQSLFHYGNADNYVWNEKNYSSHVQCLLCSTNPFPLLAHYTKQGESQYWPTWAFSEESKPDHTLMLDFRVSTQCENIPVLFKAFGG